MKTKVTKSAKPTNLDTCKVLAHLADQLRSKAAVCSRIASESTADGNLSSALEWRTMSDEIGSLAVIAWEQLAARE